MTHRRLRRWATGRVALPPAVPPAVPLALPLALPFALPLAFAVAVSVAGCLSDDGPCDQGNMDCFCGGSAGGSESHCESLDSAWFCASVAAPCNSGSTCRYWTEVCAEVCIEPGSGPPAQCTLEGLHFHGPGGLAVGHTRGERGAPIRPVLLRSGDYGRTWSLALEETAPPGCTARRIEEVRFRDAALGWLRVTGEGPGCASGLYRTTDGGAAWEWLPFPTADGSPLGGGPLYTTPAVPGWVLAGGPRPALSRDDGTTWEAIGRPPVPPGDATGVPTVVGFALPGAVSGDWCIAVRPGTAVYCGLLHRSAWVPTLDVGAPVLALADNGRRHGERRGVAVAADETRTWLLHSLDEGQTWQESPLADQAPPADAARLDFLPDGQGTLVLQRAGELDHIYVYGMDSSSSWWDALRIASPDLLPQAEAVFVHTVSRLWWLAGGDSPYASVTHTPSQGALGVTAQVATLPEPVTWTGLHLGLGAAPALPW